MCTELRLTFTLHYTILHCMHACMDGWMEGGMEGWRAGGLEGWRDGWMHACVYACMDTGRALWMEKKKIHCLCTLLLGPNDTDRSFESGLLACLLHRGNRWKRNCTRTTNLKRASANKLGPPVIETRIPFKEVYSVYTPPPALGTSKVRLVALQFIYVQKPAQNPLSCRWADRSNPDP